MAWSELRGPYWRIRYRTASGQVKTLPEKYLSRPAADDAGDDFEAGRRQQARGPAQAPAEVTVAASDPGLVAVPAGPSPIIDNGGETLTEWVGRWRAAHRVAEATRVKNDHILDDKILPAFGDWPLTGIKRLAVKQWAASLSEVHVHSSIRSFVTLLSTVLTAAVDEELLDHNPITGMRLGSHHVGKRAPRRPILSIDQLLQVAERLAEEHGYPAYAQAVTAAYTGMRWGETCGLDRGNCHLDTTVKGGAWIDIDPDEGALHEVNGHLWLGPPKSEAAVRRIDLPDFLADILAIVLESHHHAQVFVTPEGEWPRRSNYARRIWRPALDGDKTVGWGPIAPGSTVHGLRHLHKTILDELDLPEVLKHDRMGHRMRGIAAVYSHVTPTMRTQVRDRLQEHWDTHTQNTTMAA